MGDELISSYRMPMSYDMCVVLQSAQVAVSPCSNVVSN